MQTNVQGHIIKRYDAELQKLEKRVLKMGELVREQLDRVQLAILEEQVDVAQSIIDADRPIDVLELKVDKLIIKMIARRSPIGGDLRFIVAASRMVSDIERIGDEASNMAQSLIEEKRSHSEPNNKAAYDEVSALTRLASQLFEKSLIAFGEASLVKAQEIAFGGAGADGELHARLAALTELTLKQQGDIAEVFNLVLAIRSLERIVGHIQNIGEHVIYLISGEDVRHQH